MTELGVAPDDLAGLRAQPLAAVLAAQERAAQQLLGVVRAAAVPAGGRRRVLPRRPLEAIADGRRARRLAADRNQSRGAEALRSDRSEGAAARRRGPAAALPAHAARAPAPTGGCAASRRSRTIARRARDATTCRPASSGSRSRRIVGSACRRRASPSCRPRISPRSGSISSPGSRRRSAGCSAAATRSRSRSCSAASTIAWCSASWASTQRWPGSRRACRTPGWPSRARAILRHAGLDAWPRYDAQRRATMVFGEQCRVEHAPFEAERSFWD